jgi:hypothetical protein
MPTNTPSPADDPILVEHLAKEWRSSLSPLQPHPPDQPDVKHCAGDRAPTRPAG